MGLLKSKIVFYQSMATMIDAGVSVVRALNQHHPTSLRKIAQHIATAIERGEGTFSELAKQYPGTFSPMETRLLKIGEQTGRLDLIFNSLSTWLERQRQMRTRLISGLAYPIFLYHFAAVLVPFISYIIGTSSLQITIIKILLLIVPCYLLAFVIGLVLAIKKAFFPEASVPGSGFIFHVPIIGKLARASNYASFFEAFSLAMEAGIGVIDAIRLSADTCRNSSMKKWFHNIAEFIYQQRCPFFEAFAKVMPPSQKESIAYMLMESGEMSGKSVETAAHLGKHYREEAEQRLGLLISLIPKFVYIGIVVYIGILILSSWAKLMEPMRALL